MYTEEAPTRGPLQSVCPKYRLGGSGSRISAFEQTGDAPIFSSTHRATGIGTSFLGLQGSVEPQRHRGSSRAAGNRGTARKGIFSSGRVFCPEPIMCRESRSIRRAPEGLRPPILGSVSRPRSSSNSGGVSEKRWRQSSHKKVAADASTASSYTEHAVYGLSCNNSFSCSTSCCGGKSRAVKQQQADVPSHEPRLRHEQDFSGASLIHHREQQPTSSNQALLPNEDNTSHGGSISSPVEERRARRSLRLGTPLREQTLQHSAHMVEAGTCWTAKGNRSDRATKRAGSTAATRAHKDQNKEWPQVRPHKEKLLRDDRALSSSKLQCRAGTTAASPATAASPTATRNCQHKQKQRPKEQVLHQQRGTIASSRPSASTEGPKPDHRLPMGSDGAEHPSERHHAARRGLCDTSGGTASSCSPRAGTETAATVAAAEDAPLWPPSYTASGGTIPRGTVVEGSPDVSKPAEPCKPSSSHVSEQQNQYLAVLTRHRQQHPPERPGSATPQLDGKAPSKKSLQCGEVHAKRDHATPAMQTQKNECAQEHEESQELVLMMKRAVLACSCTAEERQQLQHLLQRLEKLHGHSQNQQEGHSENMAGSGPSPMPSIIPAVRYKGEPKTLGPCTLQGTHGETAAPHSPSQEKHLISVAIHGAPQTQDGPPRGQSHPAAIAQQHGLPSEEWASKEPVGSHLTPVSSPAASGPAGCQCLSQTPAARAWVSARVSNLNAASAPFQSGASHAPPLRHAATVANCSWHQWPHTFPAVCPSNSCCCLDSNDATAAPLTEAPVGVAAFSRCDVCCCSSCSGPLCPFWGAHRDSAYDGIIPVHLCHQSNWGEQPQCHSRFSGGQCRVRCGVIRSPPSSSLRKCRGQQMHKLVLQHPHSWQQRSHSHCSSSNRDSSDSSERSPPAARVGAARITPPCTCFGDANSSFASSAIGTLCGGDEGSKGLPENHRRASEQQRQRESVPICSPWEPSACEQRPLRVPALPLKQLDPAAS
ncbi:hypothetical protein cyc_02429 [Cyclospora cayetanensis]|uniref:Uncharacterized protein n=1 Tax=Cyclospora cayetanensis TaxID=88456 RepID=A0A1D3CYZ0_9EIME|nr:hypothetical protein cyc_02429 [Cyclospora cayetanensis]